MEIVFVAHALNNYLNITAGTVDLLLLLLADHPDPQIRIGLEALQQATNLMTHTVSQLMMTSTGPDAELESLSGSTYPPNGTGWSVVSATKAQA